MRILGINAIFHNPAAALVVDGKIVAASAEERFSRRRHGKRSIPFSAWELPEQAARWCLAEAGLTPDEIDAVACSHDPTLVPSGNSGPGLDPRWERLRTMYAQRAPYFLATALPGLDPCIVQYVPHHVAHAASAGLAAPFGDCGVLVLDGRGETGSYLAGQYRGGELTTLARQEMPHSLGLMYADLAGHLGYPSPGGEETVLALAAFGIPRFACELHEYVRATGDGRFQVGPVPWESLVKPRRPGERWTPDHADLAASVQLRVEEVLVELAGWLHERTGGRRVALAGDLTANYVANSRIAANGPYDEVWVQPAAGDAGSALGAALHHARDAGETITPRSGADLGCSWSDADLEKWLRAARVPYERPHDLAGAVAGALASDQIVGWFQGRSEWGSRALGHRALLANPGDPGTVERLNAITGNEEFMPVTTMVRLSDAGEVFDGPPPSPYAAFACRVRAPWRLRLPAAAHASGKARVQAVDPHGEPLLDRLLQGFAARTGLPVISSTCLSTPGRPMADDPRDALECFGSAPIDLLAIGPYVVRRGYFFGEAAYSGEAVIRSS